MPESLDNAAGERMDLDDYYADFERHFWHVKEFWKLERGQTFAEPGDELTGRMVVGALDRLTPSDVDIPPLTRCDRQVQVELRSDTKAAVLVDRRRSGHSPPIAVCSNAEKAPTASRGRPSISSHAWAWMSPPVPAMPMRIAGSCRRSM